MVNVGRASQDGILATDSRRCMVCGLWYVRSPGSDRSEHPCQGVSGVFASYAKPTFARDTSQEPLVAIDKHPRHQWGVRILREAYFRS
jgi:hypothetical protein